MHWLHRVINNNVHVYVKGSFVSLMGAGGHNCIHYRDVVFSREVHICRFFCQERHATFFCCKLKCVARLLQHFVLLSDAWHERCSRYGARRRYGHNSRAQTGIIRSAGGVGGDIQEAWTEEEPGEDRNDVGWTAERS